MSRMSIAYQCWEIGGGPTVGYKLAHGQTHGLVGPQYVVGDGSTLRRHSSPSHEASFQNFAMYMQPQSDPKGQSLAAHPKDVSAVTTVRFASSPVSGVSSSPHVLTLISEACSDISLKQPQPAAASETHVTTSSVTTEANEKVSGSDGLMTTVSGPCEAQSRRLEGVPGTIVGGHLSKFHTALLPDRGLRAKVSCSKPGVVGRIAPLSGGLPCGGPPYGSPTHNALPEHSSESSSSICQASEDSSSCTSEDTGGDMEAQSAYRGPLTKLSSLDESLPIKRPGLSKFFGGKSRSFSSLAEVSTVTDLAKPNNPYAYVKRRKMGFNCPLDRHRSYPPPSRASGVNIAKKLPSSGSRNTLAVAVRLGGLQEDQQEVQEQQPVAASSSLRSSENKTFPSRSFSLTDLPHAGSPPPLRRAFVRP